MLAPAPTDVELDDDPGVVFETARRLVAVRRVRGELRYDAGGKAGEGEPVIGLSERGTFVTVADVLRFAAAYLADGAGLDDVGVPRAGRDRL